MMKALPMERILTYNYHSVTFLHSYDHIHICMYNNFILKGLTCPLIAFGEINTKYQI